MADISLQELQSWLHFDLKVVKTILTNPEIQKSIETDNWKVLLSEDNGSLWEYICTNIQKLTNRYIKRVDILSDVINALIYADIDIFKGIKDIQPSTFSRIDFMPELPLRISEGVVSILEEAFEESYLPIDIYLPSTLKHIGLNAFRDIGLSDFDNKCTIHYNGTAEEFLKLAGKSCFVFEDFDDNVFIECTDKKDTIKNFKQEAK